MSDRRRYRWSPAQKENPAFGHRKKPTAPARRQYDDPAGAVRAEDEGK